MAYGHGSDDRNFVVNFVRTRGVDHSWKIASAAGAAVTVVVSAAGNIVLSNKIYLI